ncbi:sulfate transporter CysZ [Alteromonas sp. 5E99-2]|uniref:sulfate transporter CysZ n=1 Tax=Alteromonas sp. 5E99-2 TaxID=2817683 RepID=UPI001A9826B9|nr:sulfate transporter CysZ [Alteromonas sp. 5E99-2]MBO1255607.1 sulfate transporter CysZ [Alteromonas sp. 5E99-2]
MNHSGFHYFFLGFSLIRTKGLKRFVLIPLVINLILFGTAFSWLFSHLGESIEWILSFIPDYLSWLKDALAYIIWPLAVITALFTFAFLFSTIANIIAAPFNGFLSEKVERHLTGQSINDDGWLDLIKDTPRLLAREWRKIVYYVPRVLICLLALFIIPVFGQVIWFLFGAWMMAVQYCDYPFDNHKIDFKPMRQLLKEDRVTNVSFGMCVSVTSFIPIVNLVVMPVAVCGATALFVDKYRNTGRIPR